MVWLIDDKKVRKECWSNKQEASSTDGQVQCWVFPLQEEIRTKKKKLWLQNADLQYAEGDTDICTEYTFHYSWLNSAFFRIVILLKYVFLK